MEGGHYKIGVLVHAEEMVSQYKRLEAHFNCTLIVKYATVRSCMEEASRMEQVDGVRVMIAHSRHVEILREHIQVPLVSLPDSEYALACALARAKRYGPRIAFVDYAANETFFNQRDYHEIAKTMSCPQLKRYPCVNNLEIDCVLDAVEADGYDVVIGGSTYFKQAVERRKMPNEFIHVRDSSIIWAVSHAIHLAKIYESASRQIGWMNSFLTAFPSGIIAVQKKSNGAWYISDLNDKAVQVTGVERRRLIKTPMATVLEQYPHLETILSTQPGQACGITLNEKQYIVVCSEIIDGMGEELGKLYQIQTADEIKSNELQLRQSVMQSGFAAKTTFQDIVGRSAALQEAVDSGTRFAAVMSNVLVTGESGSGKEMFAQSIHNASPHASGPFLAINCATLPESLLEAELFGYESGTFTGASKKGKQGLLELAHRGTLFLDEIAEMPLSLQAKLLRVLQERSFRRIGGNQNILVDIRIISATHKNLAREVQVGNFRADLLYRLNVLPLHVPSLRDRPEDIPVLIQHFSRIMSGRLGIAFYLTRACVNEMCQYTWPGNIRELMNFIERLIVLSTGGTVSPSYVRNLLAESVSSPEDVAHPALTKDSMVIPIGTMEDMDEALFRQIYDHCGGSRKKLMAVTQMSHTTLWRRLKQYNLMSADDEKG